VHLVSLAEFIIQPNISVELIPTKTESANCRTTIYQGKNLLGDCYLTPSSQSTSFNAIADFSHKGVESCQCRTPNLPERLGIRWYDVGHLGNIRKGDMDTLIRHELLTKHCHVIIRSDQRIQGVDACPRISTRMRALARELAMDILARVHECSGDSRHFRLVWEECLGSTMAG